MVRWKEELAKIYSSLSEEAPEKRALDVGTGMGVNLGVLLRALPREFKVYSVDVDPRSLSSAEKMYYAEVEAGRLTLVEAPAEKLPFEDGFFGLVAEVTVLHHVGDRGAALVEAHRVLAPGGFLVVMDWTPESSLNPHSPLIMEESMREVLEKFKEIFYVEDVRIYRDYYIVVGSRR